MKKEKSRLNLILILGFISLIFLTIFISSIIIIASRNNFVITVNDFKSLFGNGKFLNGNLIKYQTPFFLQIGVVMGMFTSGTLNIISSFLILIFKWKIKWCQKNKWIFSFFSLFLPIMPIIFNIKAYKKIDKTFLSAAKLNMYRKIETEIIELGCEIKEPEIVELNIRNVKDQKKKNLSNSTIAWKNKIENVKLNLQNNDDYNLKKEFIFSENDFPKFEVYVEENIEEIINNDIMEKKQDFTQELKVEKQSNNHFPKWINELSPSYKKTIKKIYKKSTKI